MQAEDIVIIGAGPAGAATSMFLSKEKIPHTIIDKSIFPRDKICGDALSGKVVNILNRLDTSLVSAIEENKAYYIGSMGVKFVAPNRKDIDIPFSRDISQLKHAPGFISKRINFDDFLVKNLNNEFADIRLGTEVSNIQKTGTGVKISLKKNGALQDIDAKLVIGADGDRSIVMKALAGQQKNMDHYCAGLRVYYEGVTDLHPQNFIELHFIKNVLPGYFWIFPLPNGQANVGIGMRTIEMKKKNINLKHVLQNIIDNDPIIKERFKNAKPLETMQGWGLPLGSVRKKLSGDNFLLAGDSASLIDPFTGEGIGNAMFSGMVASRHIQNAIKKNNFSAAELNKYDHEIYSKLGGELKLSYTLQRLVKYPWLFNFVVNKAKRNKTLQETLMSMFEDLGLRAKLKSPSFYFKLLWD